ncbi:putative membrane protein [Brevundimonas nasdae]|uniref:aa3-type cytochrome c oxidase subunit IV n=1 Tax=Brevundimonas nasdae TaxID=172043 RepID=UPI0019145B83|nr:aa3-type cytochrome c oxidase subunit IV [Brevundimonas nasdae]MBK6025022.1 aa3-type cytochrome c oxidase subunit IV [Brevundimonas nasdae]MDQ0451644.1 putative membrane protein [Brevundimonas nasdae]
MADSHTPAAEAHADAHDYQRGSMQITEQASTFDLFIVLAKWGSLSIAVLILALTLWFHPGGSFGAAFIGAAVLAVAGFFALKSKPGAAH